jgi:SacI restriction endonuclease
MARALDYAAAKELLSRTFEQAEADFRNRTSVAIPEKVETVLPIIFGSRTKAYREALLGCAIAHILDPKIDVHKPYVAHGEDAFSARELDQRVVNPFLQEHAIPSTGGPYLSVFRRSILFEPATAKGWKDKAGFAAMLDFLDVLQNANAAESLAVLRRLLREFVALRDAADIPLRQVARLSIEQYGVLISGLLATKSGGLIPVLLVTAMFQTMRDCYGLDWEIEWQGINVADRASGVGGDVTIRRDGKAILAIEITERAIDRARVVSTFNTKISPASLDDYIFVSAGAPPTDDARDAARRYFAAGHDINFIEIQNWIISIMTTIGPKCRARFSGNLLTLLGGKGIPASVKVAWNDQIVAAVG